MVGRKVMAQLSPRLCLSMCHDSRSVGSSCCVIHNKSTSMQAARLERPRIHAFSWASRAVSTQRPCNNYVGELREEVVQPVLAPSLLQGARLQLVPGVVALVIALLLRAESRDAGACAWAGAAGYVPRSGRASRDAGVCGPGGGSHEVGAVLHVARGRWHFPRLFGPQLRR